MEGLREALPPQVFGFSVPVGGCAADWYRKDKVLGEHPEGTRALQASRLAATPPLNPAGRQPALFQHHIHNAPRHHHHTLHRLAANSLAHFG
jgi:hypothetical protein